jgi:hypothetical protein
MENINDGLRAKDEWFQDPVISNAESGPIRYGLCTLPTKDLNSGPGRSLPGVEMT